MGILPSKRYYKHIVKHALSNLSVFCHLRYVKVDFLDQFHVVEQ